MKDFVGPGTWNISNCGKVISPQADRSRVGSPTSQFGFSKIRRHGAPRRTIDLHAAGRRNPDATATGAWPVTYDHNRDRRRSRQVRTLSSHRLHGDWQRTCPTRLNTSYWRRVSPSTSTTLPTSWSARTTTRSSGRLVDDVHAIVHPERLGDGQRSGGTATSPALSSSSCSRAPTAPGRPSTRRTSRSAVPRRRRWRRPTRRVSTTAANVSWRLTYTSTNRLQKSIPATCLEKTALTIDNGGTVTSP